MVSVTSSTARNIDPANLSPDIVGARLNIRFAAVATSPSIRPEAVAETPFTRPEAVTVGTYIRPVAEVEASATHPETIAIEPSNVDSDNRPEDVAAGTDKPSVDHNGTIVNVAAGTDIPRVDHNGTVSSIVNVAANVSEFSDFTRRDSVEFDDEEGAIIAGLSSLPDVESIAFGCSHGNLSSLKMEDTRSYMTSIYKDEICYDCEGGIKREKKCYYCKNWKSCSFFLCSTCHNDRVLEDIETSMAKKSKGIPRVTGRRARSHRR